jgi:hypothetical protein
MSLNCPVPWFLRAITPENQKLFQCHESFTLHLRIFYQKVGDNVDESDDWEEMQDVAGKSMIAESLAPSIRHGDWQRMRQW